MKTDEIPLNLVFSFASLSLNDYLLALWCGAFHYTARKIMQIFFLLCLVVIGSLWLTSALSAPSLRCSLWLNLAEWLETGRLCLSRYILFFHLLNSAHLHQEVLAWDPSCKKNWNNLNCHDLFLIYLTKWCDYSMYKWYSWIVKK